MTAQVFRTRRAFITLADTLLVYEPRRSPPQRVSIARAEITEVRLITLAYWSVSVQLDVLAHHRGGVLTISHVGHRTAQRLRAALVSKRF